MPKKTLKPVEQQPKTKITPGVTNDFKMGMVVVVFLITCFHLFEVVHFPNITIVSNEVLLGVVLLSMIYLWVQEVQDRRKLEVVNKELITAQEELKEAHLAIMKALIVSEEARDPYISGHSRRVTKYAMAIADKMDMDEDEKKHLEYAGYLHDIGKIGISDAILHKPGKLDKDEWEVIKRHPVVGVDILEPLNFLPKEKKMIRHHHERYDGGGYPDGLKGGDIPFGSRILCVADSFDAMNSNRPYRPPMSREKIVSELETSRGTQFDPKIVDVFLALIEEDETIFSKK